MRGLKLLLSITGLSLSFLPVQAQQGQQPPPAPVRVDIAKSMEIAPVIDLPATVISRNDSNVATEIAGRVTWIAEVGTQLQENGVVARLDDAFLKLELADAEATVKRLEARLGFESRQVERFEELATSNSTPAQRVDEVRMTRSVTEQELNSAKLAVERIKLQLDRTVIRAPFPARVVSRSAQIGEFASVGSDIARLVDTQHLEARVQAPIATNAFIKEDMQLTVKDGGEYSEYPIRAIVPVGDEISRTIEIRVAIPADKWVIGTPLRISVPNASPRQTLAVPRDALILRRDDTYVFRIGDDNTAERIAVRTGAANGNYIEVFGPVKDGDNLVIRGGERLQAGRAVSVLGQS
jgi:RND family efflux transporter MFP subunit